MKSSKIIASVFFLVIYFITKPVFGATSFPGKRAPPGCEHLSDDEEIDLCYNAVVDQDGSTYCERNCNEVLKPFLDCAGNNTWPSRNTDEAIKALEESCVTDKTTSVMAISKGTILATVIIAVLAAVLN